jgi:integrase
MGTGKNKRANGIMERKGNKGEITFYIRYQFNGKDIRERVGRKALGFTRDMAKDALRARLGEIAQGRFSLEKTRKPVPFSQLAERYREYGESAKRGWADEKHILARFAKRFGDTPLSQLTQWQIEKWKVERSKEVKPNTVNRELTVIKHMLRMAIEWGMATSNPASGVKRFTINDQRTRFLKVDEVQTLLDECRKQVDQPWLLPLVILALHTGMRKGELCGLSWNNVHLDRSVITINQPKTQRVKTLSINEPARQALAWFAANRYGDYLLMWPWGKRVGTVTIYDAFNRACTASEITDFRFNDLRHTFASHIAMSGGDLLTLKDLLGHTNIQMTTRYAHLFQEHKAQAVTRLAQRFESKPASESASVVSPELKEAIGEVLPLDLAQSRHVSFVRKGRGLKVVSDLKSLEVARDGIEPPTRGFSVLCSTD